MKVNYNDPVITGFVSDLREKIGNRLIKITLFGSRARGEAWEGSDYDFAIIIDHRDHKIENEILDAVVRILDQYDELISTQIFDESEWELESRMPLGILIEREGVII